jgi:hypothetical protein
MGFGINLRLGLKWASDKRLAAKLEDAWHRFEAAKCIAAPLKLEHSDRGPIRHPLAYRFISVVSDSRGLFFLDGLDFAFVYSAAAVLSSRHGAIMHMHLALCDLADIHDEIARRVSRRRR